MMHLIKWLVKLYPEPWRQRYEDEFLAMMEQKRINIADVINIFAGIVDAHLFCDAALNQLSEFERMRYMLLRLQRTVSKGLVTFLAFMIPCVLFNAMLDDSPFLPVMRQLPAFQWAYRGFTIGCLIAGLAVLTGGSLILFDLLRWFRRTRRKDVAGWFAMSVAVFAGCTALFFYLNWPLQSVISGWIRGSINELLVFIVLIASVAAICQGLRIRRLSDPENKGAGFILRQYKFGIYAAPVAAAGMTIASLSLVAWILLAATFAPIVLHNSNLGIFRFGTMPLLVFIVVVMAVASVFSGFIAARGTRYLTVK